MLAAIDAAQNSVCLETYIFTASSVGERFRDALLRARLRGVRVRVMYDAIGGMYLPWSFWQPLLSAGGEVRQFNPLALKRFGIRDHRKVLLCDEHVAFVGGFNIAPEFEGDGVISGWCDIGLRLEGPFVRQLRATFDEMFARTDFLHKRPVHFRRFNAKRAVSIPSEQILLSGPGRGRNPMKAALRHDLARAENVQIVVAYFLPTWKMRRALARVAWRGGKVQLILAGKTDVRVSQLAGQSLYRRLLKAGVEIYEYQPQILHAKLFILEGMVYVGSANLDQRSLNINYELMVRFENPVMAARAREIFADLLQHCRRITLEDWRRSRTLFKKLEQRLAYWLLVHADPYVARRQWKALPK